MLALEFWLVGPKYHGRLKQTVLRLTENVRFIRGNFGCVFCWWFFMGCIHGKWTPSTLLFGMICLLYFFAKHRRSKSQQYVQERLQIGSINTSFFKVTRWFSKWRSLKPRKGHLWVQTRSLWRTWYVILNLQHRLDVFFWTDYLHSRPRLPESNIQHRIIRLPEANGWHLITPPGSLEIPIGNHHFWVRNLSFRDV